MKARWPLLTVLYLLIPAAPADEFRPAYLQLTQTAPDQYDVLWKVPALDENTVLKVQPSFPAGTATTRPVRSSFAGGAVVQRWAIDLPGGLEGHAIDFPGVATTRIDVVVRLVRRDGTVQLGRIFPASPSFLVTGSPRAFEVVRTYTVLGIEHILTGFDHLLFVLALVILPRADDDRDVGHARVVDRAQPPARGQRGPSRRLATFLRAMATHLRSKSQSYWRSARLRQ